MMKRVWRIGGKAALALLAAALLVPALIAVAGAGGVDAASVTDLFAHHRRDGGQARECQTAVAVNQAAHQRLDQALSELVTDGTLTQAQADAVRQKLTESGTSQAANATPAASSAGTMATPSATTSGSGSGMGRMARLGRRCASFALMQTVTQTVSTTLHLTPAQVVQQVRGGQSLAEIAQAQGVSRTDLVNAIATAVKQRLDTAVTNGVISADQRTKIESGLVDRLNTLVDRHPGQRPSAVGGGNAGAPATPGATPVAAI